MDLEQRVEKLEEQVKKLELDINSALSDIKSDVIEIKAFVKNTGENDTLKDELILKDVKSNTERITKIENTQSKLLWTVLGQVVTIIAGIVVSAINFF